MSICNGCGGVVGRDCYNPQECEWISRDMEARRMAEQYAPDTSALEQRIDFVESRLTGIEQAIRELTKHLIG